MYVRTHLRKHGMLNLLLLSVTVCAKSSHLRKLMWIKLLQCTETKNVR